MARTEVDLSWSAIGRANDRRWIDHIAGGTPELPQFNVGHLAQAFADLLDVFGVGLDAHAPSREPARSASIICFEVDDHWIARIRSD